MNINVEPLEVDCYSGRVKKLNTEIEECFTQIKVNCEFDNWNGNAKNNFDTALSSLLEASNLLSANISGISTRVEGYANKYRLTEKLNAQQNSTF